MKGKNAQGSNRSIPTVLASKSTHAVPKRTWVHVITMEIWAALAAANAGEGGDGVPVAIAVAEKKELRWL